MTIWRATRDRDVHVNVLHLGIAQNLAQVFHVIVGLRDEAADAAEVRPDHRRVLRFGRAEQLFDAVEMLRSTETVLALVIGRVHVAMQNHRHADDPCRCDEVLERLNVVGQIGLARTVELALDELLVNRDFTDARERAGVLVKLFEQRFGTERRAQMQARHHRIEAVALSIGETRHVHEIGRVRVDLLVDDEMRALGDLVFALRGQLVARHAHVFLRNVIVLGRNVIVVGVAAGNDIGWNGHDHAAIHAYLIHHREHFFRQNALLRVLGRMEMRIGRPTAQRGFSALF